MHFNSDEALVLNYIQNTVPLVSRPFKAIGEKTGLPEQKVMDIIADLKKQRVIRNIAAVFNPKSLGYHMGLIGMKIPFSRIDSAKELINSHPGVSHNYIRNHHYNVWFTLAEENKEWFEKTVDYLANATGTLDTLILETDKVFKIRVKLPIGETTGKTAAEGKTENRKSLQPEPLTQEEKAGIRLLLKDLPVVRQPFLSLTSTEHDTLSEDHLISIGKSLQKKRVIRRYAAVLRHMNAGFSHNAMTVWKPPADERMLSAIDYFKQEAAVTHLYLRTYIPGKWEYPLFAMIHARSKESLMKIVRRLSDASGINEYQVLESVRELKKEPVIYFSPEFEKWHEMSFS